MKPGTIIPVRKNGKYTGQNMKWTESCMGEEILREEKVFFHSAGLPLEKPLREFREKETCLYEGYAVAGHVYAFFIPAGTKVRKFRGGERRVFVTAGMKVVYIGSIVYDWSCRGREVWRGKVKEYMETYGDYELLPENWQEK